MSKMNNMNYIGKNRHDYKYVLNERTGQYENKTYNKVFNHGSSMTEMKRVVRNFMKYQHGTRGVKSINDINTKDIAHWVKKQEESGGWRGEGLAPSSVKTYANHLCKFFQVEGGFKTLRELGVKLETVKYTDATRSRVDRVHDKQVNLNNPKVQRAIEFNKGVGLRRNELENIRGDQIQSRNYYNKATETYEKRLVIVFEGADDAKMTKGGRERIVPVLKSHEQVVLNAKNNLANSNDKVFGKINGRLDIHAIRRGYAKSYYNELKKEIGEKLNKNERVPASSHVSLKDFKENPDNYKSVSRVYETRKTKTIINEKGEEVRVRLPKEEQDSYDRVLVKEVISALGHNRDNVVPMHYL